MDLRAALIEAGATRIRLILMTSLTTILSMIPMALAIGSSGSTTQGMAIVDIGGLTVGIAVALFMLPVYYGLLSRREKKLSVSVRRFCICSGLCAWNSSVCFLFAGSICRQSAVCLYGGTGGQTSG